MMAVSIASFALKTTRFTGSKGSLFSLSRVPDIDGATRERGAQRQRGKGGQAVHRRLRTEASSAGRKSSDATSVNASDSASSLPMLAVPG